MKDKHRTLQQALKEIEVVEPLKINLAATVTGIVFKKEKAIMPVADKWLYAAAAIVIVCMAAAYFQFKFHLNFTAILPIVVFGAYLLFLSYKEFSVFKKKCSLA